MRLLWVGPLFFVLLSGVASGNQNALPRAEQTTHKGIIISVDPRVEVMAVVQELSHYRERLPFLMAKEEFPYRTDVLSHFARFRDHAVVQMFDELSAPRQDQQTHPVPTLSFAGPAESMLYVNGSLVREHRVLPDSLVCDRYQGQASFDSFLVVLRDFVRESDFGQFYSEHRAYYARLVEAVEKTMGSRDYVEELESFCGIRQAGYSIILVPLYGPVGYGPRVKTVAGQVHVYSIIGPRSIVDGSPVFGDEGYFTYMQRHEFSHSFVNPLTVARRSQVSRYSAAFERLPELAKQKVCGDWEECVNEHIVRAVTTYLAFQESPGKGEEALALEQRRGMIFVKALVNSLHNYASDRGSYPTLDGFYDHLLEVFSASQ